MWIPSPKLTSQHQRNLLPLSNSGSLSMAEYNVELSFVRSILAMRVDWALKHLPLYAKAVSVAFTMKAKSLDEAKLSKLTHARLLE